MNEDAVLSTDQASETVCRADCPLSHRMARRFFTFVIVSLLLLLAASLLFVFVIQG